MCLFSLSLSQLIDNLDINAFKSLIIPGWGQMELSENTRSRNFLILETCSWLSFLGSYYSDNWYTDNYMSFGSNHDDINLYAISDSEIFSRLIVHISQYDNDITQYFDKTVIFREYNVMSSLKYGCNPHQKAMVVFDFHHGFCPPGEKLKKNFFIKRSRIEN